MDNIELIKRALNVEIKNKYINIRGRKQYFSDFMMSHIRHFIKASPMPDRWKNILECFRTYSTSTYVERKKYIEFFIKVLKQETTIEKQAKATENNPFSDVTYVKGVGPRIAAMLHKIGIFTASDLLFYLPRKHIDYSRRTKIADLRIGQTTTVMGYIKSTDGFITPKGLGIIKVKVADETGFVTLNFFQAKSTNHSMLRIKSKYPRGAGIVVFFKTT